MSRLLLYIQGLGSWKATAPLTKPVLQEALPSRLGYQRFSRNYIKAMHGLSSVRLGKPGIVHGGAFGTGSGKKHSPFAGHIGQSNIFSGSIIGLRPQNISSVHTVNTDCFYPSSHLNGRTKKHSPFTGHTGQANCFPGSIIGLRLQDTSSFQTVSTVCFHTSSHLKGRVTDFLRRHGQGLREAPLPALVLGLSGLIPFLVPAVYTAASFTIGPNILWAQVAYGASILSFLGGTRWGFVLRGEQVGPTWFMLGYSVVPSLIAWLGLLMPLQASQLCIMCGLLIAWAADMSMKAYPAWFRSLRLVLSLLALLSLGVSYGFCLVYEPTSEAHGSNVVKLIKIVKIILED